MDLVRFKEVNLDDPFFDSLKQDYQGFEEWFKKKSEKLVFIQKKEDGLLEAFLYLKREDEALIDVRPQFAPAKRLKVGTFKIDAHNTKLGEKFIRKIVQIAIETKVEEIYLTIFEKHEKLVRLLKEYGFEKKAEKGDDNNPESVLVKSMKKFSGDICKDYPFINTKGVNKYLLSIKSEYHTKLFPDSILYTERKNKKELVKDVAHTNSIHKIYLCRMNEVLNFKRGDIVVIYRNKTPLEKAEYKSVATSLCVVEEIKRPSDFNNWNEFKRYTNIYSIFEENVLQEFYRNPQSIIIKMTYNVAFDNRVIRKDLADQVGLDRNAYWGALKLTDNQFEHIIKLGEVDESFIID